MKNFIWRMDKNDEFMHKHVFAGLTVLTHAIDSPLIKYFSESDFEIVLQRVKKLGIGILGIEPWNDEGFYGVETCSDADPPDPHWYEKAFQDFKNTGEKLMYAATYYVPEELYDK